MKKTYKEMVNQLLLCQLTVPMAAAGTTTTITITATTAPRPRHSVVTMAARATAFLVLALVCSAAAAKDSIRSQTSEVDDGGFMNHGKTGGHSDPEVPLNDKRSHPLRRMTSPMTTELMFRSDQCTSIGVGKAAMADGST
jgi:hypothetical protein